VFHFKNVVKVAKTKQLPEMLYLKGEYSDETAQSMNMEDWHWSTSLHVIVPACFRAKYPSPSLIVQAENSWNFSSTPTTRLLGTIF